MHPMRDASPRPTATDMRKIASLVYSRSGIALRPDVKEAMVVARLQKRLRSGGFKRFADYLRHVEQDRTGTELTTLLDALILSIGLLTVSRVVSSTRSHLVSAMRP